MDYTDDKISVIVPVYNVEKFLPDTIFSLRRQTYPNYEIILVDDGSIDTSGELCDKYAHIDDRIRVYHQENRGVSAARNTGINNANGTFITFVDADDIVESQYLDRLYHDICLEDADFVIQRYDKICTLDEKGINISDKETLDTLMNGLEFIEYQILDGRDTSSCAKLYKKEILEKYVIRFDEQIANLEDMLFIFEYAIRCKRVQYNSVVNYHRVCREGSFVFSPFNEKKMTAIRTFEKINAILLEMHADDRLIKKNEANLFHNVIYFILNMLGNKSFENELKSMRFRARKLIEHNNIYFSRKDKVKFYLVNTFPCILEIYNKIDMFRSKRYLKYEIHSKNNKHPQIMYINNIPSPYRIDFFRLLAKKINLTVLFENRYATNRDNSWKRYDKDKENYDVIYLDAYIRIRGSDSFAPSVIKYIVNRKNDYIMIGSHGSPTQRLAILIMRLFRIPFIFNMDGDNFIRIANESRWKYLVKKYLIFRGAKLYITSGDMSKSVLKYYGVKEKKIKIFPFSSIHEADILKKPVDIDMKRRYREELGMSEKYIVICVGSIVHGKGQDIIIKESNEFINDVGVYFIGGDINDECRNILYRTQSKTQFHFVPFKEKEELKKYYCAADVFILPTRMDSWGLVINEAFGYGLPIVTTTACNAGLEMIENGVNGFVVDVSDPKMFIGKINQILQNEKLNADMRVRNLKKAHDYTIEKMAEVNEKIISDLISGELSS